MTPMAGIEHPYGLHCPGTGRPAVGSSETPLSNTESWLEDSDMLPSADHTPGETQSFNRRAWATEPDPSAPFAGLVWLMDEAMHGPLHGRKTYADDLGCECFRCDCWRRARNQQRRRRAVA